MAEVLSSDDLQLSKQGVESFPAAHAGFEAGLGWFTAFGEIGRVGVVGTGSWGVGLALFLHVARETIWAWTQDAEKAEFTNLIGELMAEQEFILAAKGTAGEFNAPLTKLFLHKHGHSDKLETKTTGQISVTVSEQDLAL